MRIDITAVAQAGLETVTTSHKGESLDWEVSAYKRMPERAMQTHGELFKSINAYWATLPEQLTDNIWAIYGQLHQIVLSGMDIVVGRRKLQTLIKQLYEQMPVDHFNHWIQMEGPIIIPPSIKEQFGPNDPPELTYLREDYRQLCIMAIYSRPLIPIWGMYINSTVESNSSLGGAGKELAGLALLYDTQINYMPAMLRLEAYTEALVAKNLEEPSASAVLGGMGTTELPVWIRAQILIRRLAIADVTSYDESNNVITNIYNFVVNQLKSNDRRFYPKFGGKVTKKRQPASKGEEQNSSVVELYKVKQEISEVDLVPANIYTEQVFEMARRLAPGIEQTTLVAACQDAVRSLETAEIQSFQIFLTMWVVSPVMSARGGGLLTKPALLRTMAVTQAVLWHWGFYDLAALVTATPIPLPEETMIAPQGGTHRRISKEQLQELEKIYKYYPQSRNAHKTSRQLNVGARAIDGMCDMIVRCYWQMHAPEALVQSTSRTDNSRRLTVPPDIRTQLFNLVKVVAERQTV